MNVRSHARLMHSVQYAMPMLVSSGLYLLSTTPGAGLFAALVGGLTAWWATRRVSEAWWYELFSERHQQLLAAAGDAPRLRPILDELGEMYALSRVPPDAYLRLQTAYVLLEEERFAAARAEIGEVDVEAITEPYYLLLLENNLAWAMAHDGSPRQAVLLVERSLERLRTSQDPRLRPLVGYCLGTLGAALVQDGQPAPAVDALQAAIETGGEDRLQVIRCYYLGVALEALDRRAEAIDAWSRAAALQPDSPWGRRAIDKLNA